MGDYNISMPAGSHYSITIGVAKDFGGMTTVMLHRSAGFFELTGTPVSIVTCNHADYADIRKHLISTNQLRDGVSIINLFEELSKFSDPELEDFISGYQSNFDGQDEPNWSAIEESSSFKTFPGFEKQVNTGEKSPVRIDRFRTDGSVFLTELRNRGSFANYYIIYNSAGQAVGTFSSLSSILQSWLDTLPRDPIAWFIIDSKTVAPLLFDYQRDDVVTIHQIHSSHLNPKTGELNYRKAVMENLSSFDGVAFLTEKQKLDALPYTSDVASLVIPNSCIVPGEFIGDFRRENFGMSLARICEGKQLGHAVDAVARNANNKRLSKNVRLEIYGKPVGSPNKDKTYVALVKKIRAYQRIGVLRKPLNKVLPSKTVNRIAQPIERKFKPVAELCGHSPIAREKFSEASFSLFTSKAEGFGMVLVESMGRGCIPISYDINYGPGEIITDGVNGFLVAPDDINGLADAISRFVNLNQKEVANMRRAAFERAQDFNSLNITRRWIDGMIEAFERKRSKLSCFLCGSDYLGMVEDRLYCEAHRVPNSYAFNKFLIESNEELPLWLANFIPDRTAFSKLYFNNRAAIIVEVQNYLLDLFIAEADRPDFEEFVESIYSTITLSNFYKIEENAK